ncbi:hypothetical protein Tco_1376140 [Tanacetum coccineum]
MGPSQVESLGGKRYFLSIVDDYSRRDSFISDGSMTSKPSVTELNVVNDKAFMVYKKYVNITDLNLVSDEKVSIFDRDDLEKKVRILQKSQEKGQNRTNTDTGMERVHKSREFLAKTEINAKEARHSKEVGLPSWQSVCSHSNPTITIEDPMIERIRGPRLRPRGAFNRPRSFSSSY